MTLLNYVERDSKVRQNVVLCLLVYKEIVAGSLRRDNLVRGRLKDNLSHANLVASPRA